jgi:hypothetical protein
MFAACACTAGSAGSSAASGTGAGPAAPAPERAALPEDGCRDPDLDRDPACGDGPFCGRADRVRLACGLRDALESRYVFYHLKSKLLAGAGAPFDARRRMDACVAAEREIAREPDPLRFLDRIRRCLADFEDGHLFLSMPRPVPSVSLGIRLRRTGDGRVYVAYRDPGVARWLDQSKRSLEVGEEVVAIDGCPVAEALAELAAFIPSSSEPARLERAVDALGRRDFAFPEGKQAILTVSSGSGQREVSLPWFIGPGASSNPLAAPYCRRVGLSTSDRIDWRADPRGAWFRDRGVTEGLLRGDPVVSGEDAARLTTYRGDGGQLSVRLGEASAGGPPACYAQILSFHTERLVRVENPASPHADKSFGESLARVENPASPHADKSFGESLPTDASTRPFCDVLRDFLRGCQERHQDLVLDLRQNEGGYLSHSSSLAAMLTPRETISPGGALLLRATAQNERVYRDRSPMLGTTGAHAQGEVPSEPEQILMAIRDARRAREEFTPAFLESPLSPDADLGFAGRVVALTSPGCMSACDRLAAILKRAHRAVLVGGATEGAGASQQESKDQSARWVDSSGMVGVSIPNAAMGVQTVAAAGVSQASAEEFFDQLAFENRPVAPDEIYATTLEDLVARNRGWLRAARAALQRADPAAPRAPLVGRAGSR